VGILIITTLASCILSILGMMIADHFLTHRIALVGSFVGLQLSRNPGIAFGLHLPPVVQELLIGLALLIVLWLAIRSSRSYPLPPTPYPLAYGLILGGGIANIIDRLSDGLVTDYFQVGTWPIFNVADSCITIGVLMLLLEVLVLKRRKL
jgi:signal peptidase II